MRVGRGKERGREGRGGGGEGRGAPPSVAGAPPVTCGWRRGCKNIWTFKSYKSGLYENGNLSGSLSRHSFP